MKKIITTSVALLAAGAGLSGYISCTQEPERPNIIFILADDMGWGDLNLNLGPGSPDHGPEVIIRMPHLEALAASGVRFTNGYANHLVSAPTRAGFLTGRYQQRLGYFGFDATMAPFPEDVVFLPEPLQDAGYATALIGKWHVSYSPGSKPLDRGFERFFGFLGGEHDFYDPRIGQSMHRVTYAYDGHVYDQDTPVKEMDYLTDELTKRSVEFIESATSQGRPFFLYLSHHAPHIPLQVPWEDLEPFALARNGEVTERDLARAMMQRLDTNIGILIDFLIEQRLYDNTLIIFASDNGGAQHCYNGGLRGRKGYFYEGGIRVPTIASWPGRIPAGQVLDEPVITHDVFPTALAAAGIAEMPEGVEGVNWLPYMMGDKESLGRERLYWGRRGFNDKWAVREGRWKLVYEDSNNWFGSWPIIEDRDSAPRPVFRIQLYDLETDPYEQTDMADRHPDIVERLTQAIKEFHDANPPSLATEEVSRKAQELYDERMQNPDRYPRTHRIDGSPGRWIGEPR